MAQLTPDLGMAEPNPKEQSEVSEALGASANAAAAELLGASATELLGASEPADEKPLLEKVAAQPDEDGQDESSGDVAGVDSEKDGSEKDGSEDEDEVENVSDSVKKVISETPKPEEAIPSPSSKDSPPETAPIAGSAGGLLQRKGRGDSEDKLEQAASQASVVKDKKEIGEKGKSYADLIAKIMPLLQSVLVGLNIIIPYVEQGWGMASEAYQKLPKNVIGALYGISICFFGGTYVALIAAIEAFRLSGAQENVMKCLEDMKTEAKKINEKSKEDDKKDDDGDGIPDVEQIDSKELVLRKWGLIMRTVNPVLLSNAIGGLYQAFLAILVTLKFKFARTVALAMSMAAALRKPANRYAGRFLKELIPEEYGQWIPIVIDYATKVFAMTVAWWLQRVMSAIQSAISGGLTAARCLLDEANKRGFIEMNEDDTYIDEAVGWGLAVFGVYFQLMHGFSVGFPFNIVLFPLTILEWVLQWCITWVS